MNEELEIINTLVLDNGRTLRVSDREYQQLNHRIDRQVAREQQQLERVRQRGRPRKNIKVVVLADERTLLEGSNIVPGTEFTLRELDVRLGFNYPAANMALANSRQPFATLCKNLVTFCRVEHRAAADDALLNTDKDTTWMGSGYFIITTETAKVQPVQHFKSMLALDKALGFGYPATVWALQRAKRQGEKIAWLNVKQVSAVTGASVKCRVTFCRGEDWIDVAEKNQPFAKAMNVYLGK